MDQRLQHIVEHYDEMCIGTDEHFRFHCKQCGKCCINREDILLNPKDLLQHIQGAGTCTTGHHCTILRGISGAKLPNPHCTAQAERIY